MFRLILLLPFNVLIMCREAFATYEDAERFWQNNYAMFPAFEIWSQGQVDNWKSSTPIQIPLGD